jgi:uncharacterized protein YjbJ (UPF0337 family)
MGMYVEHAYRPKGRVMADNNKISNKAQELRGKVKEGVGDATDDPALERQGKSDQTKGNLKQAGEKVKDAFKS